MKKFEYKQVVVSNVLTTDVLNTEYGLKGWELITVIIQAPYNYHCYIFKREKP